MFLRYRVEDLLVAAQNVLPLFLDLPDDVDGIQGETWVSHDGNGAGYLVGHRLQEIDGMELVYDHDRLVALFAILQGVTRILPGSSFGFGWYTVRVRHSNGVRWWGSYRVTFRCGVFLFHEVIGIDFGVDVNGDRIKICARFVEVVLSLVL